MAPLDENSVRQQAFAHALSEGIKRSGLTLEQIAERLRAAGAKTSQATLSYWQNGHSVPTRGRSLEVVRVLEGILGLPQAGLSQYLAKATDTGHRAREVFPDYDDTNEVLASMGLSLDQNTTLIASTDRNIVHRDGTLTEIVREVMRVEAAEVSALPLVYDDPFAERAPRLTALSGGHLGRVVSDDARGRVIAALQLPRSMARGERFWVEFRIDWAPTSNPVGIIYRFVTEPAKVCTSELCFEAEPPGTIHYIHKPAGEEHWRREPVHLVDGATGYVLEDVAPGAHGFYWHDGEPDPALEAKFAD